MATKRPKRIESVMCPRCAFIGSMRQILYGMPDPDVFDFEKYVVGGCCVSPDGLDPDIKCKTCDWKGFRKDLS